MAFLDDLLVRTIQIILVPSYEPDTIWSIAPLFFGLVMMQMYFGKYKTEQLGWNTAYGNSVSLVWASFVLFRFMYVSYGWEKAWMTPGLRGQLYLVFAVAALTLALVIFNYRHALPKNLAFFLGSSVPTTVLAYLVIVIVMGRIPVDTLTLIAGAIIFICIEIIFRLYRTAIDSPAYVQRVIEKRQKEKKKEMKKVKRKIAKKVQKVIPLKSEKKGSLFYSTRNSKKK